MSSQMVPHRLIVSDQEEALVLVLHLDPILQRAQIVSKMQLPGGPHSGEYAVAGWT